MKERIRARGATALSLVMAAGFLSGCDTLEDVLAILGFSTGPRELSDEDAFRYMRVDRTDAPETDVRSVQAVLDREVASAGGGGGMEVVEDPGQAALLARSLQARLSLSEEEYDLVDFGSSVASAPGPGNCAYEVDLATLRDEYIIPHVGKIPVRDQGRRGTCAAFAGVGNVEYAAINPASSNGGNPSLPTLDLSEQWFYWASKPECREPGSCRCPGCQEGSWYGVGMEYALDADNETIPLETDCPYNNRPGNSDTQTPLLQSCTNGAVKVETIEAWCGLDSLIRYLDQGYAVPYASPLSGNWERTDGLITKAALDAGATRHAGGHAYLIVGYKKLPDLPQEGGLCFYIKNSWGEGWGIGGYACMTLAWMREVTFRGYIESQQPVVYRVELRDDLIGGNELPPDNEEAEDMTEPDVPDNDTDLDEGEKLPPEEPDLEPTPEPLPEPLPQAFRPTRLLGPNQSFYKIEIAEGTMLAQVRARLRGTAEPSLPVRLERRSQGLYYKGDEVGQISPGYITLCTDIYSSLCSLRFRASDRQLYVQFRDDDLRAVQDEEVSEARGNWIGLGSAFGLFVPNDLAAPEFVANPKTFLRLGSEEPLRLSIAPGEGSASVLGIRLSGIRVGELNVAAPTSSALCSGAYGSACQFVSGDRFQLVPRNSRRPTDRPPGQ